jgi:phenylalanyl-tRNA synthetase beta chain
MKMATVTFELKDFWSSGFDAKSTVSLFEKIGVEVESVDDTSIMINVNPNRPDLLDFNGILRAFRNFVGKKVPSELAYNIDKTPLTEVIVSKNVKQIRPFIGALIAKNVDLTGNKLKYLINFTEKFCDTFGRRRRKLAIGIHDLSKIDGSVIYDADLEGKITPLNKKSEMRFDQVMESLQKGQEYADTVKRKGKTGKPIYPYIKDSEKVLALIPITNCEETRVTESTTDIFIDMTGTSLNTISQAANLLACSLIDSGAEVFPVRIDYGKHSVVYPELEFSQMRVTASVIERTLGVIMGKSDMIAFGNKMGYPAAQYGNSVLFYTPPYRVDVLSDRDIVEDVAIAFGYDNISPLPVAGTSLGLPEEVSEQQNELSRFLIGLGYSEAMNTFLTNEEVEFARMSRKADESTLIRVSESKTSAYTTLRSSLIPGLMGNRISSTGQKMPIRLFEIGHVFRLKDMRIVEGVHMAAVSEHAKANFAEMRSVIDELIGYAGLSGAAVKAHTDPAFIEGRCAAIMDGNDVIGVFGEIHPKTLLSFGIDEPVVALEFAVIKEIKYKA